MTNKPFEVQDDAIVLNGVQLQVTQEGTINVNGTPSGGGFSLPPNTTFNDLNSDGGATIFNTGGLLELYSNVGEDKDGVKIRVKGTGGDSAWLFKSNGSLTLPGELKGTDNGPVSIVSREGSISTQSNHYPTYWEVFTQDDVSGAWSYLYTFLPDINNPQIVLNNKRGDGNTFQWIFDGNGDLSLPEGGDILDSNGNSILDKAPVIPNTVRGFIDLVGDKPNNEDDIWFESVVVQGQYAYVLGGDYYIANDNNEVKVYKFDLQTGAQVWVKQITAGRGAQFNVTVDNGVITIDAIASGGQDYKIGETLVFYGYQIGGNYLINKFIIQVDTIDEFGAILTASLVPGYDAAGLTGTYNSIQADNNAVRGDTVTIGYDDYNNKIVVIQEYNPELGDDQDNYWQWNNIYVVDPETGVINQTVSLTATADVYANSVKTYNKPAGVAVVGEKYGEYREFGTLTILTKGNGYFDILKSNLDPEHYPDADQYNSKYDFWITGTGINSMQNVDYVNYYSSLATVTREGSGAAFQIVSPGSGFSYVDPPTVWLGSEGTNYLVGHKIKILGTSLGGATPDNDAIITITQVGEGGSIVAATISGTAGDIGGTYNNISGTNYNVGNGALISIYVDATTGAFSYGGYNNGGSNYVVGDVLTILGTAFANGTTPANDATLVVNSVSGSGEIQSIVNGEVTGIAPTDALRLVVDTVDFTVEGSWSMKQNLGGEAFIWTPAWSNAIGGPSGDRFYDVTWNGDGTALYAVGTGQYEVPYTQALVVKFNAETGAVIWSKDIKFDEASTNSRYNSSVVEIPGSTDIMVSGTWYNGNVGRNEIILTRMTDAGFVVWQKTYLNDDGQYLNDQINLRATNEGIIATLSHGTNNGYAWAYLVINPTDGTVIRHRALSSDGNSNYFYYNTPTPNFADIYTDSEGDHVVMAGYTYVPTDYYYNALLVRLPVTGLKDIAVNERYSIGEHIMTRHSWTVTAVTSSFDNFTPDEHINTITNVADARNYKTRAPDGELKVFTTKVTDDTAGYLEFGDGSKQSFATDIIPQIPAANDYYLTAQDSGKHIFFENESGNVYIPHWADLNLPVGFTFTIVNTTGSNCYVETQPTGAPLARGVLKLAGRNISTYAITIPDSGSGSMVTFLKVKQGYYMPNSAGNQDYPDVWIVSGPSDISDNG